MRCEATTACQHTSPPSVLVSSRCRPSSQRWRHWHRHLPFHFRKGSTQANQSKDKNTTVTHREHNSCHQGPQAGFFWRQFLVLTGTPASDSFGANLMPCCPPAALLMSPRAFASARGSYHQNCFVHSRATSFCLFCVLLLDKEGRQQ